MVFDSLLNPAFSPLKNMLHPLVMVILISLIVSIIIIVIYRLMTDQTKMKDLKMRQKEFQKKMKSLKKDPEKMMKVQKEAMSVNMEYMKSSMKPTLITFLPIIIIFGWMNANMAFHPIMPDQEFSATLNFADGFTGEVEVLTPEEVEVVGEKAQDINNGQAVFNLKAAEGDYLLVFQYNNQQFDKEVSVSAERYAPSSKIFKKQPVKSIVLSNEKLIVMNLFGWKLGWLGTYIIFSIIFSMSLRKIFKIY
jgi:uncharacterized membrane protein (DUF106 family)